MRLLWLVPLVAGAAAAGELSSAEKRAIHAAKTARASVVAVLTNRKKTWHYTGVVVARDLVLTLRHPFVDETGRARGAIRVRFPEANRTVDAEIVDSDAATDTVLLEAKGGKARPLKPRLADRVHLGMWVVMVGNSFLAGRESTPTVSLGVVSGVFRGRDGVRNFLASTLVNPGSHGAPIVDLDGGLLGIAAAKVTPSGGQSVIVPYEHILASYREKKGPGSKALGSHIYGSRRGKSLHEQFGLVMEAAAERARVVLVGVRAGDPNEAPPAEEKKKEEPPKKGRQRQPRDPPPVAGKLPAYDRSSGTLVTNDGLVVCPLRVTGWPGPVRKLVVDLPGGAARPAVRLGWDERRRIALLSVDVEGVELPPRMPPEELDPGRFVLALGFPHEEPEAGTPQVTFGVVSRRDALQSVHPLFRAVQTDAGVSGGNRGGPLVDIEGRLIGVLLDVNDTNRMGYQLRKEGAYAGNAGLGFAVPMHVLDTIVPRMAKGDVLRDAKLGVNVAPDPAGVKLAGVSEDGGAKAAGLKPGDIIVFLGGHETKTLRALKEVLLRYIAGEEVEVTYLRDGTEQKVRVKLGS